MDADEANELVLITPKYDIENGDLLTTIHNIIKDKILKGDSSAKCVFNCEDSIDTHWTMARTLMKDNKYEKVETQLIEEGYCVSTYLNKHYYGGDEYIYFISWDKSKHG